MTTFSPGTSTFSLNTSCATIALSLPSIESTNGLDPIGIEELRELIKTFPEQGITVILSSHILSEVQMCADYIGIISDGVLGYEGKLLPGQNLEELFMDVVKKNRKLQNIE